MPIFLKPTFCHARSLALSFSRALSLEFFEHTHLEHDGKHAYSNGVFLSLSLSLHLSLALSCRHKHTHTHAQIKAGASHSTFDFMGDRMAHCLHTSDLSMCVTCRIHTCDMTCLRHVCPVHMCDMTHSCS